MALLCWLLLLSAAYPLGRAWRANRGSTLRLPLGWGLAAWAGWGLALAVDAFGPAPGWPALRYLALCLTACAGVAVLGARRPGALAWNFVVAGLLAVLLLPVAQGLDQLRHRLPQALFLAAALLVGVVNYLPTCLAPAALLLAAGCTGELLQHAAPEPLTGSAELLTLTRLLPIAAAPWAALATWRTSPAPGEFDRIWLRFRNGFGLVWGQRVREQFNRSAANAGWPARLAWQGLLPLPGCEVPDSSAQQEMRAALRALLKRFEPNEARPW